MLAVKKAVVRYTAMASFNSAPKKLEQRLSRDFSLNRSFRFLDLITQRYWRLVFDCPFQNILKIAAFHRVSVMRLWPLMLFNPVKRNNANISLA